MRTPRKLPMKGATSSSIVHVSTRWVRSAGWCKLPSGDQGDPSGQPVHRARILSEDHRALLLGHCDLERRGWVVVVPVRIVSGEHQAIPADPVERVAQVLGLLGLLDRLCGEPELLADVFRRWASAFGHFV